MYTSYTRPKDVSFSGKLQAILLTAGALAALQVGVGIDAVFAADAQIGESELVTILRATKVVPADGKLTASISGDEIVVTTTKKAGATDDACKIQAVLIAKTVFDSVKNDAQRTKIIYFDFDQNSYSEVAVKRAEVKMYGSGQLTEKELLASLELKKGEAEGADDEVVKVVGGPLQPDRVVLSARLARMEKEGVDTKNLQQMFNQLEEAARSGNKAETVALYRQLKTLIDERETAYNTAHHFHPVASNQSVGFGGNGNFAAALNSGRPPMQTVMTGPDGKMLYDFAPVDVPNIRQMGGAEIRGAINRVHNILVGNAPSVTNLQGAISAINGAVHSLKSNDINQYRSYMATVHQLLGMSLNLPKRRP